MEPQTLHKIINSLEADATSDASFSIFSENNDSSVCNIRANPQGLKRFAAAILKAADAFEANPSDPFELNLYEDWVGGNVHLNDVYFAKQKPAEDTYRSTWKDNFGCAFFILIAILLAAIFITGLVTIVLWIL